MGYGSFNQRIPLLRSPRGVNPFIALVSEIKTHSDITTTALVPMSLPEIKITGHGILALRLWRFSEGWLHSTSILHDVIWREQMIADKPPAEENSHGLYGTEFSPEGLMKDGYKYFDIFCNNIFGLVQMRGEIEKHTDCTLRGEWARIVCLFVPLADHINEVVPALIQNYPSTPIYILHHEQIAEVLFRTLNQRRQQDDDQRAY